jgi:glycosyltransferase involved in cell wall biosynthesis
MTREAKPFAPESSLARRTTAIHFTEPRVRLYIPVRNGANFIRDCIQSIVDQTYRDWLLTVSDNRSTDNTEAIVSSFGDSRISFQRHEVDIGMIANFNSCIDQCDDQYYAILSHDDKFSSDTALADAIELLQKYDRVAAVYSDLLWIDECGKKIIDLKLPSQGIASSDAVALKSILSCRNCFGVPVLLRRGAVGNNRYDEHLKHTADVDFSAAVGRGKDIYIVSRPLVAIRFHKNNGTMRSFASVREEMLVIARKMDFSLSAFQKVRMIANDRWTRLKKALFFLYLDRR